MAVDGLVLGMPGVRIDRALVADLRALATSRTAWAMGALVVVAGVVLVTRRGPAMAQTLLLIWSGLGFVAFLCWWAGRHRLAHGAPDLVPRAKGRLVAALAVAAGLALGTFGIHGGASAAMIAGGVTGWLLLALRRDGGPGLAVMLRRSWRPFVPLLLLVALPRIALTGVTGPAALVAGLTSGVIQQLLFLPMLFASLEAVLPRRDTAAVVAALLFGAIHVPMNLAANEGDWLAALANAVVYQSLVGLIVCFAFTRHRAALPLGVAHGLAIA